MAKLYPVILCGGSGTRLWPLSRTNMPKQFLNLQDQTFFQQTLKRVQTDLFEKPIIVSNQSHQFLISEQLSSLSLTPEKIILEPSVQNTAPALTAVAHYLEGLDEEAYMLVLPSDHLIDRLDLFYACVEKAYAAAQEGLLTTFGIKPLFPETGYGYIYADGEKAGVLSIEEFVEKPDMNTAKEYCRNGHWYWNSGMFLFPVKTFLEEINTFQPDVWAGSKESVEKASDKGDVLFLDKKSFASTPEISLDYAVMEPTQKAAMVPSDFIWSDVGSWGSLWDVSKKDENENVVSGDVFTHETKGSYLHSEGPYLATLGLEDVVVIATKDTVLVADKHNTQNVRHVVSHLKKKNPELLKDSPIVKRPWGAYKSLALEEGFQVKHIKVNPGQQLSLQKHLHRAEHWFVLQGRATVTRDEETIELSVGESIDLPKESVHRLQNFGSEPVVIIEIQQGDYLGEDDIIRLQDTYGRA